MPIAILEQLPKSSYPQAYNGLVVPTLDTHPANFP